MLTHGESDSDRARPADLESDAPSRLLAPGCASRVDASPPGNAQQRSRTSNDEDGRLGQLQLETVVVGSNVAEERAAWSLVAPF